MRQGRFERKVFARGLRLLLLTYLSALLLVPGLFLFTNDATRAQSNKLVLISQETSTRAVAVDSVTQQREPFNAPSTLSFSADHRTRIILFVMGLDPNAPSAAVTAFAEDQSHRNYELKVEFVG